MASTPRAILEPTKCHFDDPSFGKLSRIQLLHDGLYMKQPQQGGIQNVVPQTFVHVRLFVYRTPTEVDSFMF